MLVNQLKKSFKEIYDLAHQSASVDFTNQYLNPSISLSLLDKISLLLKLEDEIKKRLRITPTLSIHKIIAHSIGFLRNFQIVTSYLVFQSLWKQEMQYISDL